MKISILDIGILIFSIVLIIFSIVKTHLINKTSGEIIVRKRFTDNIVLRIFIKGIFVILVLVLIYFTYKDNDFSSITTGVIISFPTIFFNFIYSTQFYTIYEKGICLGFCGFLKWEDIKGFEMKNGFLQFKTNKNTIVSKLKNEPEYIEKVESILEKNMVIPIL